MPDHAHFEELAALAAGGHLATSERDELRQHLVTCAECRESLRAYSDIVVGGLPLVRGAGGEAATAVPPAGARDRFLARARSEGIRFSAALDSAEADSADAVPSVGPWKAAAAVLALAAALVMAIFIVPRVVATPARGIDAQLD